MFGKNHSKKGQNSMKFSSFVRIFNALWTRFNHKLKSGLGWNETGCRYQSKIVTSSQGPCSAKLKASPSSYVFDFAYPQNLYKRTLFQNRYEKKNYKCAYLQKIKLVSLLDNKVCENKPFWLLANPKMALFMEKFSWEQSQNNSFPTIIDRTL